MEQRAIEADFIALGIAKERSRRRARDHRLPLIGRKSGRIAGEAVLRVNSAAKDRQRLSRPGLPMAMMVDAQTAGFIERNSVWASRGQDRTQRAIRVGHEGDDDEASGGRRC